MRYEFGGLLFGEAYFRNFTVYHFVLHFVDVRKSKERQASKKFYNTCSENSRSQIVFRTDIFRKLTLGAPDLSSSTDLHEALILKTQMACLTKQPKTRFAIQGYIYLGFYFQEVHDVLLP